MNNNMRVSGFKGGGGGSRTPVESPDSLISVSTCKMLIALSVGETDLGIDAKRILLDGTPIEAENGERNFDGVTFEFRDGTPDQDYIKGFPVASSTFTVGREVKNNNPYVFSVNDLNISAVRIKLKGTFIEVNPENGDKHGVVVDYAIDLSVDGAGYETVLTPKFDGKQAGFYERDHRIDLPKANTGWQIRVRRITQDHTSTNINDKFSVESFDHVIDAKLKYPYVSLLYVEFNAKLFNGRLPTVTVKPRGGRLVKVPDNYDPVNRVYSGIWGGSFKMAVSNNPVWVVYDLVTSNYGGLGDRVSGSFPDKWDLYSIAKYCDELIPDGRGGNNKEPRFMCDIQITEYADAYKVLSDICNIFNGYYFYAQDKIRFICDKPEQPKRFYTNASVINGEFSRSSGGVNALYSHVVVSYQDPYNHNIPNTTTTFDNEIMRLHGFKSVNVEAIGCKRESEAQRRGKWIMLTNKYDQAISFKTSSEALIPQYGSVIGISDYKNTGRMVSGRLKSYLGRALILDRVVEAKVGDRIIVNTASGDSEARTIDNINGKRVEVTNEFNSKLAKDAVFVVESVDLVPELYRVMGVKESGSGIYEITAIQYEPQKHNSVDYGASIDERPVSQIPVTVQKKPENVKITSYSFPYQGVSVETMVISWDSPENAISFEVQWRKNNGDWVNTPITSNETVEISGVYSGSYRARVRAINAYDVSSLWADSEVVELTGKQGNPDKPIAVRTESKVFGIQIQWDFPKGSSDTLKTEIQYSKNNNGDNVLLLSDVPYPSKSYTMAGIEPSARFYFRLRLVDKIGNVSDWTDFVEGISEFDASVILPELGDQFISNEIGNNFQEQINALTNWAWTNTNATSELAVNLVEMMGESRASIREVKALRVTDQEAFASWQTEVKTQFENNESKIYEVSQSVSTLEKTTGEKITHLSSEFDAQFEVIEIKVNEQGEIVNAQGEKIDSQGLKINEQGKIVDSQGREINSIKQTVNKQDGEIKKSKADIERIDKTVASVDEAQATFAQLTKAQFEQQQAMIEIRGQTVFKQNGDGYAIHTIKTGVEYNGKYYDAKFVIGAQVAGGQVKTQIGFSADTFGVFNPSSGKLEPVFFVENGKVYMNKAFISQATVNELLVGSTIKSKGYDSGAGFILDANSNLFRMVNNKGGTNLEASGVKIKDETGFDCIILGDITSYG